jgi:hypothetical protein
MIRKKLKTSELQNIKTKNLSSFQKKSKYLHPCETSHKSLKIPKMTRRKLNILKFQNTKTKFSKFTCPISSLVKLHTNFFEDPQNDKKKIKDSETSKYKNKKTQIVLKTHKMTRRQIENFKTSK